MSSVEADLAVYAKSSTSQHGREFTRFI